MSGKAQQVYARKQLALRKMLTDGRGHLNADARCLVADLRRFCKVGRTTQYSAVTGAIDVNATLIAVGRQEVFERLERMLLVDKIEILMTSEDD